MSAPGAHDPGVRVGTGYDVHRADPERPLVLCGVELPDAPFGLAGHSDADAPLHALGDACLGALALGDIGTHFPDDDPAWAGSDSKDLLRRIVAMLTSRGWGVVNADVTIIAQRPRLAPRIREMRVTLAEVIDCPEERVSVKATTHEGLGPLGRGEGIAAHAAVLLARTRRGRTEG
ncbi:MAG: 2-C-methyl-D-erythritol 2,4-cyclodiphosphate synthase [bacterium]